MRPIKPFSLLSLFFATSFFSCQKAVQDQEAKHYLASQTGQVVKIDQASLIYDSTALADSLVFPSPPTNRIYKWTVTSDSLAAFFSGRYLNGEATLTFRRSGTYHVSAAFYDSLTNRLLGHTTTETITVTTDTLYPTRPIMPGDTLDIQAGLEVSITRGSKDTVYFIQLNMMTAQQYPTYNWENDQEFVVAMTGGGSNYSIVFSDSTRLNSFPFVWYPAYSGPVAGLLALSPVTFGVPVHLSITWLGKTYTGSLMAPAWKQLIISWDSGGGVTIRPS